MSTNEKTIEILLKLNDQMGAQLSLQTENMEKAAKAADKLAFSLKTESKAQEIAKKETIEANNALKSSSQIHEETSNAMGGTVSKLAGLALAYVSVTSAIGLYSSAIRYIAEIGGNFEQSMANVRAILQPTSEEFAALSYSAKDLGATTQFTAAEAADAYTELGKVGFSTSEILASGNDVLNLAIASNIGIEQAATDAATVVRQFGLTAGETAMAVDIMTKSYSISALGADNFSEAMQYVGPVARQAGVGLSEASAALGVLADEGIKGSMAGTSLRRIIVVLGDSSSEASKQIAKFHPEAKTLTEKLHALGEMGMDTTTAMKLFRIEASTGAMVLASSGDKVRQYGDALDYASGNTKGFAERVASIQMDTFQGDIKNMQSGLENVAITFAQAFGPMSRDAVQFLNEKFEEMSKWAENNPAELQRWASTANEVFRSVISIAESLGTALRVVNVLLESVLPEHLDSTGMSQFQVLTDDAHKLKLGLDDLIITRNKAIETDKKANYELDAERINAKDNIKFLNESIQGRNEAIEAKKKEMSVTIDQLEAENRLLVINRSGTAEDAKRMNTLNSSIPAMKRARDELISYADVQRKIGKETADRLKAEGNISSPKKRGTGIAGDLSGLDVNEIKRKEEEQKKADEKAKDQFKKLSEDELLATQSGVDKIILANKQKWDDILAIDKKGGAKHQEELKAMGEAELGDKTADYRLKVIVDAQKESDNKIKIKEAENAANNAIADQYNAKQIEMANALEKKLQDIKDGGLQSEEESYASELILLQNHNMSTEELTKIHEDKMQEIKQASWEKEREIGVERLKAASSVFGGMAALIDATNNKDKKRMMVARTLAIAQIGIDTWVAATAALGAHPWTLANIGLATGMGLMGAANAAKVANIKFAQGQYSPDASFGLVPGTSYSGDKVLAHVNSGERILSAQQNQDYESKRSSAVTFHFAPVYNVEVSDLQKRADLRMARRELKSIQEDPEFYTTQAAI
jgi:TP901 family phage tail tape measure protein